MTVIQYCVKISEPYNVLDEIQKIRIKSIVLFQKIVIGSKQLI